MAFGITLSSALAAAESSISVGLELSTMTADNYSLDNIDASSTAATFTGYDIFVIAGQSNAVGFGAASISQPKPDPYTGNAVESKIFQLSRLPDLVSCTGSGYPIDRKIISGIVDPLHHWSYNCRGTASAGMGIPFARRYGLNSLAPNGRRVLIIPAAKVGSSITLWDAGDTLYEDMKSRINYALSLRSGNKLVSVHWQQAERDILAALDPADSLHAEMPSAQAYKVRLQQLVDNLRADFAAQGGFPIIVGQPSPKPRLPPDVPPGEPVVKAEFVAVMKAVVSANPCMAFVSSEKPPAIPVPPPNDNTELPTNSDVTGSTDVVHFSAEGQWRLGSRYYAAHASIARSVSCLF
jgi:hypothetical protein